MASQPPSKEQRNPDKVTTPTPPLRQSITNTQPQYIRVQGISYGALIFSAVLLCVAILITWLAIYNLLSWHKTGLWSILPNILWLMVLLLPLSAHILERGVYQTVRDLLLPFIPPRYVCIDSAQQTFSLYAGPPAYAICLFQLPLEDIQSFSLSAGQATHMAGQDMDDWSMFLHLPPKEQQGEHQTIRSIGESGSRATMEAHLYKIIEACNITHHYTITESPGMWLHYTRSERSHQPRH
ncbi:MAG TPA: hypothetical protein DCE42_23310 [Myxococcales bacterium]|nr:hypothetical protein [Deltaproteobacteria bacterium]MBU50208.1 hypothetical protein [Deltaproteobacteria bacterium]HAA57715.1 hypothetical protein [Myxococcales bacterium]